MLEEMILNDYKNALKNKEVIKSNTLSYLRAQILNLAIAKKKTKLTDEEIVALIKREVKLRQEAIEKFKEGNRYDLVEKEENEIKILKSYLPEELSSEELERIIEETVVNLGAKGPRDMGRVMKEVITKVAGRADNKIISDLVRQRLSQGKESLI